ncbi:MAG: LamG-like jellyroll fold domain-containing protein [Planctomycetota bacterium]
MSKKPDDRCPPMLAPLLSKLIDSRLSDEDRAKLQQLLLTDANCRRYYMRFMQVHAAMQWSMGQARPQQDADFVNGIEDHPESDVDTFLSMLEGSERHADPLPSIHIDSSTPLTNKAYSSAMSYIVEHTFTPKRLSAVAAAAVLLLGVVLSIVLLTGSEDTPEVASLPDFTPTIATPDPNRVVATVTDQVNAQWVTANGQGALPDRMLLAVNQRLTLVKGFAEITTLRGAKVLVQAPATIETTDSDNAIRLHRGKLVGVCETPSSKGFTVHAPGMDVVDLGTRFGVEADAKEGSTVLVMEGSVRAEPATTSPLAFEPVVLETNQARRVSPETGELNQIQLARTPSFNEGPLHPYVSAVLEAQPIAYWRFEEMADGMVRNEASPDGVVLNAVGSATLTESGVIGSAGRLVNRSEPFGHFDTDEPVQALSNLDEFTVEFWYYTAERYRLDNGTGTMFNWYNPSQQLIDRRFIESITLELVNESWEGKENPIKPIGWRKGSIRVYPPFIPDGDVKKEIYTAEDYPVRRWQHLVLVQEGGEIRLYLDGDLKESTPSRFPRIADSQFRFGRSLLGVFDIPDPTLNREITTHDYRLLRGRVDEVALYDKPLSVEQIKRHYSLATRKGIH